MDKFKNNKIHKLGKITHPKKEIKQLLIRCENNKKCENNNCHNNKNHHEYNNI